MKIIRACLLLSLFVTSSHILSSHGVREPWYKPVNGFHWVPSMDEGLAVGLSTAAGSASGAACGVGTALVVTAAAGAASPFVIPTAVAAGIFGFGTTFYGVIKNLYARTPTGLYLRAENIKKAIEQKIAQDDNFAFDGVQDAAAYASATCKSGSFDEQWPLIIAEKRFQKYIAQLTDAANYVMQAEKRFSAKNNDEAVAFCVDLARDIEQYTKTLQHRISLLQGKLREERGEFLRQRSAYIKHYNAQLIK